MVEILLQTFVLFFPTEIRADFYIEIWSKIGQFMLPLRWSNFGVNLWTKNWRKFCEIISCLFYRQRFDQILTSLLSEHDSRKLSTGYRRRSQQLYKSRKMKLENLSVLNLYWPVLPWKNKIGSICWHIDQKSDLNEGQDSIYIWRMTSNIQLWFPHFDQNSTSNFNKYVRCKEYLRSDFLDLISTLK